MTGGSVLPNHPIIYEIGEQDRNLAIRILDELDDGTRRSSRDRTRRQIAEPMVGEDDVSGEGPSLSAPAASEDMVADLYAAIVSHRRRGLHADADGFVRILQREVPKLARQGIEVLGLEGVVGKRFDPPPPLLPSPAKRHRRSLPTTS